MKLKDIKEHFDVVEYNGYYLLFDKEINTSQYLNKKYYGKIKYDSKKEIVTLVEDVAKITSEEYLEDYGINVPAQTYYREHIIGKGCSVDCLKRTIDEYIKTLPYPSCFYNPQLKKNVFIELCVHDYLKRLGFELVSGYAGFQIFMLNGYNLFKKDEDYITLSFKVVDDTTNGVVSMINGSLNWMEVSFTNLDEAIGAINSLVKPVLLSSIAFSINKFDNISDIMSNLNSAEDNTIDVKTEKVYVSDAKEKVIKMLEDTLKMLKGK